MNPLRHYHLILLLPLLLTCCNRRRPLPPDRVHLRNGEIVTGKILSLDSTELRLRRPDYAEQRIPKTDVDSVSGLGLRSWLVAGSFVTGRVHYFSPLLYENREPAGAGLQLRVGRMKRGRSLRYWQYTWLPLEPFALRTVGYGRQHYLFSNYTQTLNGYVGGRLDLNFLAHNGPPYLGGALAGGGEWLAADRWRLFAEVNFLRNLGNANRQVGMSFQVGVRLSREYGPRYCRINQQLH